MINLTLIAAIMLSPLSQTRKYEVGECVYLVEKNGEGDLDNMMRIEKITDTRYIYRWWVDQGGWAIKPSDSSFGDFATFEVFTKKRDCP